MNKGKCIRTNTKRGIIIPSNGKLAALALACKNIGPVATFFYSYKFGLYKYLVIGGLAKSWVLVQQLVIEEILLHNIL